MVKGDAAFMVKTLKLMILPTEEDVSELVLMTEQYRRACEFVSGYVFDNGFDLNAYRLQKILYSDVRKKFGLKAQMAVSVFRTVTAKYKTVQEQLRQNPYKYRDENDCWQYIPKTLEWLWKPVHFSRPQADLVRSRDYCFLLKDHKLSLNTLGKRIKVDYMDNCWADYFDGTWTFGTGKIVNIRNNWYFHVPVSKETDPSFSKERVQHVVGIDRGLRFLATTYDENGKCVFKSGQKILSRRQKFIKCRQELQSKRTWSAFRKLKELSGRENRWMSDVNHQISKTLVDTYGENTLFVIEDLTGVSFEASNLNGTARQNRDKRSWAFYQLEQFLTYKAEMHNSKVLKVPAGYTSQRCPKCGLIRHANRHYDTHEYLCDKCGYRSNDDRVGAMNIQFLGTLWMSGDERPRFDVRKESKEVISSIG